MQHEPLGRAISRTIVTIMSNFSNRLDRFNPETEKQIKAACTHLKMPEMSYLIERIIQLDSYTAYKIANKAIKYDGYKKDDPRISYKEELFNYAVVLASLVTPIRMGLISDMFLSHVVVTLTTEFTPLDPCFSDYTLILAKDYDSINLWLKTLDLEDLES